MPDVVPSGQGEHNIASPWWNAGCSVVPIKTDGSKATFLNWKYYQSERAPFDNVRTWWAQPYGVAVICGAVSGSLEMTELEAEVTGSDSLTELGQALLARDALDVWDIVIQGYSEWTPSGGLHLIYRLADHEVPGNTKIAKVGTKTLAETRGEGGYVIVAPSPGECHPSGEPWTTLNGTPATIPTITWEQRNRLHAAISDAFDRTPPAEPPRERTVSVRTDGSLSPGDDFAMRVDWARILEGVGWTLHSKNGAGLERLWTRPGKKRMDGHSASTDYMGKPGLYVFSSNTGLPTEEPLSKLFVYAHYHHGGDMVAAARTLRDLGYGDKRQISDSTFMGDESEPLQAVPTTRADESTPGLPDTTRSDLPVPFERSIRPHTFTDVGFAEILAKEVGSRFRYVPVRNKWMWWDGTVWKLDLKATVLRRSIIETVKLMQEQGRRVNDEGLIKFALKQMSVTRINAAVSLLEAQDGMSCSVDEFDSTRELLNVGNGILDLITMQLEPHKPGAMMTKMMGAAYKPEAEAPRWDQYLQEVLPDEETRDFLQRMVGYTLTGNPVQRALAILHGPGGTGKSRFVEILAALFGSYGTTAAESLFRSKRDVGGPSNDLNDLRGARLASVSELDYGVKMDEALVKRLTGLDRITSRGLYEENQTWMPQCVIWLATNHLFKISSDDGAIWERVKVIPFAQRIEEKDPYILDVLVQESDGILNWMLQGLRKYREHGLDVPQGVRKAVDSYRGEQDMVTQFLTEMADEDRLRLDSEERIHTTQLNAMFRLWCQENMQSPLGRTRFYRRMETLGFERTKGADGFWYWMGVGPGTLQHGILGSM